MEGSQLNCLDDDSLCNKGTTIKLDSLFLFGHLFLDDNSRKG